MNLILHLTCKIIPTLLQLSKEKRYLAGFDGIVYDNIHKNGMAYDDWINDFYSKGGITPKVVEEF